MNIRRLNHSLFPVNLICALTESLVRSDRQPATPTANTINRLAFKYPQLNKTLN